MTHGELQKSVEANPALAKRNPHLVHPLPHPQPEPDPGHELLGKVPRATEVHGRVRVVITSIRSQFIDPDNLCPKYVIDCLRHCGAIADDDLSHIEILCKQSRARRVQEQGTLIELIPLE